MTPRRFRALVAVVVVALLTGSAFAVLEYNYLSTGKRVLAGQTVGHVVEYHADGTETTYPSAEERIKALRPEVHRVVTYHAPDIERLIEIRRTAPLPAADNDAAVTGLNATFLQRYDDLACSMYATEVHLPWLKDDMDRLCEKVAADRADYIRDFTYSLAGSHVGRRCDAAFGSFAPDYPKAERKDRVEWLDRGTLDLMVPQEAADDDERTAEVKALWDDLEADLDALVTKKHCLAAYPSITEPKDIERSPSLQPDGTTTDTAETVPGEAP